MALQEAIKARHSVRAYIDRPLADDVVSALKARIEEVVRTSVEEPQLNCR